MEKNFEAGFEGLCADMESMNYNVCDTGYLEDAIAGWRNRSKQQQTWMDDQQKKLDDDELNHFLDMPDFHVADVCCMHSNFNTMENRKTPLKYPENWSYKVMKQQQQRSPSFLQSCMSFINSNAKEEDGVLKSYVASPFDIVKRGGIEGHATLQDINFRLLMPPTRPLRHPVGEFATTAPGVADVCFGISGKEVVAFTRIHTQGRGTITVIRTRYRVLLDIQKLTCETRFVRNVHNSQNMQYDKMYLRNDMEPVNYEMKMDSICIPY